MAALLWAVPIGLRAEDGVRDRLDITTEGLELVFKRSVPAPELWRACHPSCLTAGRRSGTSLRYTGSHDGAPWRSGILDADRGVVSDSPLVADVAETPTARVVTFTSQPTEGVRFVRSFEIARHGYEVTIALRVVGPEAGSFMGGRRLAVELGANRHWSPATGSGWLTIGDDVRRVVLADDRVRRLDDAARGPMSLPARQWTGFRDRFWAMLARADDRVTLELSPDAPTSLRLVSDAGAVSARYTVYSGPLELVALGHADRDLRRLLFSGLWSWLRALSLGALALFNALLAIVGQPGLAIVLLAVAVKVVLLPIATLAHHLQAQVDATRGRLQPEIDAIRAGYRGEAQTRRLLELYRRHRVHPLYTLKSLVGVLIQLPVFIAVFDMLAENFALQAASFLGIGDLARPDASIPLPFALPAVGRRLNLLPFVMSGVSLAATARFDAPALTPTLRRRQRRNLTAVAAAFFFLFYAFPAGMVLYWTSTNALQLLAGEARRVWRRSRAPSGA